MEKWARIDFDLCDPQKCDGEIGRCAAVACCTHKLLEQELPYEPPLLLSKRMCVGCGDCGGGVPVRRNRDFNRVNTFGSSPI